MDVAEQQPETPTPMDKTTGEATKRRAPDLTGFRVQDPIAEPELMGMTATEDLAGFWREPGDPKDSATASVSPTRSDHSQR